MKCPQCSRAITRVSKACMCGFVFDEGTYAKLSVYFELNDELSNLRSINEHLISGIDNISLKIAQYEDVLNEDIKNLARETPARIIKKEETGQADDTSDIPRTHNVQGPPSPGKPVEEGKPVWRSPFNKFPGGFSQFEINLGQKWLLIIGIVTMVFGIGYFLKYSFEKGWIGPAGRIALAYLWGIGFLMAGSKFRKKGFDIFGLSVIGGGIATLYFSTFAAFQLYHLFSQGPSFFIMVLITVLASTLAIVYDTKWLAILGLIGGFLTPVMLGTGHDNQMVLMSYMTILNLGLLGIAFYKKWDILNILGFICTYLLYSGWFFTYYAGYKFWPAIIFLNIFYFIYSIIPFADQLLKDNKESLRGFMIITPNSFIAFGYGFYMVKERFSLEWVSVITIIYSLVFLSMASYLYRKNLYERDAFVVLLAKAALFLIITIPVIFSRHWITVFWAAQAIVLLWAGCRLGRKSLVIASYVLLGVALSKFLYYDYPTVFGFNVNTFSIKHSYTYMIIERSITSIFLIMVIFAFSGLAKREAVTYLSESLSVSARANDSSILYGVCSLMLFIVLNVEVSSFFHHNLDVARFAAISVLWTLFSVSLMVKGFKDNIPFVRKISFGLFFITLAKVFFFDMSKIHTPYRILSFVILGIVLICTSYLYHRFKDNIISAFASGNKEESN